MYENKAVTILKASAGSGKTFRLTLQYITLLISGHKKHRRILAVTFTNKATAEMKERILSVLEGLASDPSLTFLQGYVKQLLITFPELQIEELQERAKEAYLNILHDYSNFSISTIDKFVQKVIRSFGYELGFDPGYRIETNVKKVIDDLNSMLHKSLDARPDLIKWIVQLAKRQIKNNKNWDYERLLSSISLQIFSERYWDFEEALASRENRKIFEEGFQYAQRTVEQFETDIIAFIRQIQRAIIRSDLHPADVANKSRNRVFKLKDFKQGDFGKFVSEIEKLWEYETNEDKWVPKTSKKSEEIIELFKTISSILAELRIYYQRESHGYFLALLLVDDIHYLRLMEEMNRLLAQYRSENRLLLIGDASRLLNGITRDHAENNAFIWEKTGVRYQHFLIDEFQDTSGKQWNNFLPLIANSVSEWDGPLSHHLLVGDVKQSIYRWRNGDWRILHRQAEVDLGTQYVGYAHLEENYRSAPEIVAFNNVIFEYGSRWLQECVNEMVLKEAGPEYYQRFWSDVTGYNSVIENAYEHIKQNVPHAHRNRKGIVDIQYLGVKNNAHRGSQTQEEALECTANRLYQWIAEEKRYRPSQIGILVRNKKHASLLIDHLYQDLNNRPRQDAYQIISGDALQLRSNDVVKLLISGLRFLISDPGNDLLISAVCLQLRTQIKRGVIAPVSVDQWLNIKKERLLPSELLDNRRTWSRMPVTEIVEQLIRVFDLGKGNDPLMQHHLPYLFAFRDVVEQFSELGETSIGDFLTWWEEEQDNYALPVQESNNAVQIMTIHKSKGLAFDVVMLPFLSWEIGRFESDSRVWAEMAGTPFESFRNLPINFGSKFKVLNSAIAPQYFEEWMLRAMDTINEVYVACTRARTHLYMNLIESSGNLNTFIAGDIVRFALERYGPGSEKLYNKHSESELSGVTLIPESDSEAGSWEFLSYPQGTFRERALPSGSKQWGSDTRERFARTGTLAHIILSRVDKITDLGNELRRMCVEGMIRNEEKQVLTDLVGSALNHPELRALYNGANMVHSERAILNVDGSLYRPDKVFINDEQTIVLDFKFTSIQNSGHRKQVLEYAGLLVDMGYQNVRAFLFYVNMNQLIEIELPSLDNRAYTM